MTVNPKVFAATTAAAITTIAVWLLTYLHVTVPGEVQGAITTVIVGLAGYLTRDTKKGDHAADR